MVNPIKKTRTVPMEVMVLGLCRTSTSSMMDALHELGYHDVYHMRSVVIDADEAGKWVDAYETKYEGKGKPYTVADWDNILGDCMALCDHPAVSFCEELMDAYPNAKLVLTVRDTPAAWVKSMLQTVWPMAQSIAPRPMNGNPLKFMIKALQDAFVPRTQRLVMMDKLTKHSLPKDMVTGGEAFYEEHSAAVLAAAKARGREVLIFNAKMGYQPLCDYLGKKVPVDENGVSRTYPKVNDAKNFQANASKIAYLDRMDGFRRKGWWRLALVVATGLTVWLQLQRQNA